MKQTEQTTKQAEMTGHIRAYRIHFIDTDGTRKYEVVLKKDLIPEMVKVKIKGGVIVSVGVYNMGAGGETTFSIED